MLFRSSKPRYYNRKGKPISLLTWGRLLEDHNERRVAEDFIDGVHVSTVWLGLNHQWVEDGAPLIFETMVFGGGGLDGEMVRYSTEDQAFEGHAEMVLKVKLRQEIRNEKPSS